MKARFGIILICLALAACNSHEKEQLDKLKALNAQDSTLAAQSKDKDSLITSYVNTMGEIQDNLDSLKQKEKILSMNSPENGKNSKSTILGDIKSIDNAIIANNKEISRLEARLRKMAGGDAKLKKMIDNLTNEIAQKDSEIAYLQSRLNGVNDSMTSMNNRFNDTIAEIRKTRMTINSMTTEMNTVYYAVGTMKQLKTKGAIAKSGGVLGIGSRTELNPTVKLSAFTKADKTQLSEIPLNGKFVRFVTSHPASSYKIDKSGKTETLSITQPDQFWSESKYLVVETR